MVRLCPPSLNCMACNLAAAFVVAGSSRRRLSIDQIAKRRTFPWVSSTYGLLSPSLPPSFPPCLVSSLPPSSLPVSLPSSLCIAITTDASQQIGIQVSDGLRTTCTGRHTAIDTMLNVVKVESQCKYVR